MINKITLLIFVVSLTGCTKTYEDCILEKMKDGNSDTAARLISMACRENYGPSKAELRRKEENSKAVEAPAAEAAPAEELERGEYLGFSSEIEKTEPPKTITWEEANKKE